MIVNLRGKKPEVVDGEVPRTATKTYTLAMPMMIVGVHESIHDAQDKDTTLIFAARCFVLTIRARLREDALSRLHAFGNWR